VYWAADGLGGLSGATQQELEAIAGAEFVRIGALFGNRSTAKYADSVRFARSLQDIPHSPAYAAGSVGHINLSIKAVVLLSSTPIKQTTS
jgi:hypothetical protein